MSSVTRFDVGSLDRPKTTRDGFLRVSARLTRCGIFTYHRPDGGVRKELRLPDEVFHPDSLETFSGLPVTLEHPEEMLTPDNCGRYAKGHLGDAVKRDGEWLTGTMTITDTVLIRALKDGKKQVSVGYRCDLDETPGEWKGEHYDAVQRSVVANHVAIVSNARAGADCVVRVDSLDSPERKGTRSMSVASVRIDSGEEFEVPVEVATLVSALRGRIDALESRPIREERTEAEFKQAVRARAELERLAADHIDGDLERLSDQRLMLAVVEKIDGPVDRKWQEDASYLRARFDAALAHVGSAALCALRVAADGALRTEIVRADEDARERMKHYYRNLWRQPVEEK
jgi:uncharacterized protein